MKLALGFRTHMGWSAFAAIAIRRREPVVVATGRIETGTRREAMEPYHLAAGYDGFRRVPAPADPTKSVTKGLRLQQRDTRRSLKHLIDTLAEEGHSAARGAILSGRGKPGASLEKVLASHALIHVAEGLAVRESIRLALASFDIKHVDVDERDIGTTAQAKLEIADIEAFKRLTSNRSDNVTKWTKEEKLCALAAWISLG